MTDYKTLFGKKIKFQTSDLTMSTATEGELFYSDTDKEFKVGVIVEAWSSGENMVNAGSCEGAGSKEGTQNAAAAYARNVPPNSFSTHTEEYDGTDWSETADYPTSIRHLFGCGTQTAGLAGTGFLAGGTTTATATNEYNGTAWTAGGDYALHCRGGTAFGPQTAAISSAGTSYPPNAISPGTEQTENYDYNGSSWTANNEMNVARSFVGGCGTQTAGLIVGGNGTATSEEFDGTDWTAGTAIPTASSGTGSISGIQTAALLYGFTTPPPGAQFANPLKYDGSTWSSMPSMSTDRNNGATAGTTISALMGGGYTNADVNTTEEFSQAVTLKTVTDS